jgi:hypothetical protein
MDLIVVQLVKKLCVFDGTQRLFIVFSSPQPEPIVNQMNALHTHTVCFLEISFIVVLPPSSRNIAVYGLDY